MRTRVFAYKGMIGIESNYDADGLINKPKERGQLGFVVDANFVDIQPEALKLLKTIKRSNDCIGDVDIFQSNQGVVFSWLGAHMKGLDPTTAEGSRTYDASLIKRTVKFKTPKDFIAFVDKMKKG